ncbi:hypothetical protein DRJ73_15160, partial [Enterococcus faecalis]
MLVFQMRQMRNVDKTST